MERALTHLYSGWYQTLFYLKTKIKEESKRHRIAGDVSHADPWQNINKKIYKGSYTMRTHKDRLRHTLLYECLLIAVSIPLLSWVFQRPATHIGLLSVMLSFTAMGWNYLYNLLFDHALKRLGKPLYSRSLFLRIIHAGLFEVGLLFVTVPAVMCWMGFSFFQALALDLSFMIIVPVYTIIYNGCYDRIFPVAELQMEQAKS